MRRVNYLFIIGLIVFGSCLAQNADAQSANDAQRIVGTWKRNGTDHFKTVQTFTFNANGTCTYTSLDIDGFGKTHNGNYFFSGSKLIITLNSDDASVNDIYFSSNGRILVFGGGWYEKQ